MHCAPSSALPCLWCWAQVNGQCMAGRADPVLSQERAAKVGPAYGESTGLDTVMNGRKLADCLCDGLAALGLLCV